jgi:TrwC relaxase
VVDRLRQSDRPRSRPGPKDAAAANGGLGEYYSEKDTRAPVWLCSGDAKTAAQLAGLSDADRVGAEADPDVVTRWFDDGVAPNGGRVFAEADHHGFDLTVCAPKSMSLLGPGRRRGQRRAAGRRAENPPGQANPKAWHGPNYGGGTIPVDFRAIRPPKRSRNDSADANWTGLLWNPPPTCAHRGRAG